MTTQFECVNCGRIYAANKLSKCPVCSASGPMNPQDPKPNSFTWLNSDSDQDDENRRNYEERNRRANVSSWGATILWYGGIAFLIFIVFGILTDGYGSGGGNVPGKECFDYERPNGDWANSCDQ